MVRQSSRRRGACCAQLSRHTAQRRRDYRHRCRKQHWTRFPRRHKHQRARRNHHQWRTCIVRGWLGRQCAMGKKTLPIAPWTTFNLTECNFAAILPTKQSIANLVDNKVQAAFSQHFCGKKAACTLNSHLHD